MAEPTGTSTKDPGPDEPATVRTAVVRAGEGAVTGAPAITRPTSPQAAPSLPPSLAKRFETLGVLGQGGAGVVLRARDKLVGREVAIKLLLEGLEQHPKLLQGEATHLARLEHERIVRLYDFGLADGGAYLVMELVRGETLWKRLARGRPSLLEALAIGGDTCEGLAVAHAQGLAHSDIKPMNLFIDPAGRVKIADFGLARTVNTESEGPEIDGPEVAKGSIQGTPGYLAPEQADGMPATPASDVYAVGVVLAELLAGQRLFTGRTSLSILAAQARGPQWRPADVNPGIPAGLDELVMRCLAKDPAARPGAAELGLELLRWHERLVRAARVPAAAGFPSHPYKFLDHFEGEDAVIYFGRESEVAELAGLVTSPAVRMTLVFGPCGVGKSSLLRAGLGRSLAAAGLDPLVMQSGADPARRITEALDARAGRSPDAATGTTAGSTDAPTRPPVVIVDQLEELFTLNPPDSAEASAFFELVSRLVEDASAPVKLVLSFRTEFRGRMFELERRLARHTQSYLVSEMRAHALAAAIEGPSVIEAYQFGYEPGFAEVLAQDILATVAERGDSAAPVLQIVCRQLYDHARKGGQKVIGPAHYERALGRARGALQRYVEERLTGSGYELRSALARQMLRALTVRGAGGERFGHARDEEDLLDFPDREGARRVLDQLLSDRLVVREDGGGRGRVIRLASEVICPLIDEWAADVDEAERAARLVGRAARQWTENERRHEDLLTGGALALVERQLPALRSLSPDERALVDSSRSGRARRRASASVLALAVAGLLGGAAWAAFLRPGQVKLTSDPSGAEVVGPRGEALGVTPLTWSSRPGVYQLSLRKPRHRDLALTVRVPAGGEAAYGPVLSYPYGVLSLTSSPPGARCDVVPAGSPAAMLTTTTPFHAELPAGTYQVRLSAESCLPAQVSDIVLPGNRVLVEQVVRLERDTGMLEVRTPRPGTALVVRDLASKRELWTATLPLAPREVPSGRYLLEVHAPDHQSQLLEAKVRRGSTTVMSAMPAPARTLWKHPLPMIGRLAPACEDLDRDGTPDAVLVAGINAGTLITVNGRTGRRMMTCTLDVSGRQAGAAMGLDLKDLDGNGRADALINFRNGDVAVFDLLDGHRILQLEGVPAESALLCARPVTLDLDGDKAPDVITVVGHGVVARAPSGRVIWQVRAPPRTTRVQLADLDGGGLPEIVLASHVGLVGALDALTGKTRWALSNGQRKPSEELHMSHGDIDGDGREDVVVTCDTGTAAISGITGKPLWARDADKPFDCAVGRLRKGRIADVVVAFDEKLVCYDGATGKPLWSVPGGSWFDSLVLADMDQDGLADVLVKRKEEVLEIYRGHDGLLLSRLTNCARTKNPTAVADLNGDGIPDTLRVGVDRHLVASLGAGSDAPWTFKVAGELVSTPAMADLDGDGELEAVIANNQPGGSAVQAVTPRAGRELWHVTMGENAWPAGYVGDIDGDGLADVVIVNHQSEVYAVQGKSGRLLWKKTGIKIVAGAAVVDLDGDGRCEVVCRAESASTESRSAAPMHQLIAFNGPDGRQLWASPSLDPRLKLPARLLTGLSKGRDLLAVLPPRSGGPLMVPGAARSQIVLLDAATGQVRQELPMPVSPQGGMNAVVGDLDGDERPELVMITPGGMLEALSITKGAALWAVPAPGKPIQEVLEDQLALTDIDGDGLADVVYASSSGDVAALAGRTGRELWKRKLEPPPYTRLTLGQLDGDDVADLMMADFEGTLIAMDGKTGAPIALGLRGSLQTTALVVEPGERGPFTEVGARSSVPRRKSSPAARLMYAAPDGTLVVTPLRQLGLAAPR